MELKDFHHIDRVVLKGWGYEVWVSNSPLYCGKVLCFKAGKKLSWHYHEKKDETFFCLHGSATLYYSLDDCMVNGKFDTSRAFAMNLAPGVAFHVTPHMRHQVVAGDSDVYLMEVSTEHFEADSFRLERGD